MINTDKLNFDDTIYVVDVKNNAFSKKKLKKVIDGIEWFRYDLDNWEYTIEEIVYCGKVTYIEEGEVSFEEDRKEELHFKYPDGQIHPEYIELIPEIEEWFHTREEAETYIEELKASRAE